MNSVRAERLKYNLEKQGAVSAYVMVKDARLIDDYFSFDQILLDAPCSGSGTLNMNDKKLKEVFTQKLLNKTMASQRKLLQKAINILKVGSEMVYSTCSILKEENEKVLNKVLKKFNAKIIPIEKIEGIEYLPVEIEGTLCISPTELLTNIFEY